ncbi:MAG TPA: TetR/AcrR family transcriptional regulator [Solirubrobacteraceae bacterium]|nr:TetR/AcrR family transcriptional regulator [Solirubrobacteraceae bacterium]
MPTKTNSSAGAATARRSPRERLLAAADELFYAEGVQSVGIDRVIERAGVAKASLYTTFGSKEELVRAYLDGRRERLLKRLRAAVDAAGDDPVQRILAVFDGQARMYREPTFHGCPFARASAEAPPGGGIELATESYRAAIKRLFVELSADAGVSDPERLATQLQLLYDGGSLSVKEDRDPEISAPQRAAAAALIAVALDAA